MAEKAAFFAQYIGYDSINVQKIYLAGALHDIGTVSYTHLPGIDGFELCKRIRILVDCPILFLTAKTEENSLVNGLSLGADDYLSLIHI